MAQRIQQWHHGRTVAVGQGSLCIRVLPQAKRCPRLPIAGGQWELQLREREGAQAGNFEDAEIKAVFNLADLMQMGVISESQARKALLALANSQKQKEDVEAIELPPEVDEAIFLQKAKDALQFRQFR
ncbi:unnamed protein product [Cladocopium goreaui]|uniref:EF-hand calcium-binding domain-containing protein 10 n=1 Tax=Cladocopium goreaui TaxID=2562237 RepID=A0A9P1DHT9_9DINO|nr:unnamed protein product [Cladocopium goreaui]